jgi:2-phosphosulfolactate phosphatase
VADALVRQDPAVALAPEAEAAALAFRSCRPLEECQSGRELVEGGFAEDVRLAAEVDVTAVVPVLVDGCFVDVSAALTG